jgi:hypothetical protein
MIVSLIAERNGRHAMVVVGVDLPCGLVWLNDPACGEARRVAAGDSQKQFDALASPDAFRRATMDVDGSQLRRAQGPALAAGVLLVFLPVMAARAREPAAPGSR